MMINTNCINITLSNKAQTVSLSSYLQYLLLKSHNRVWNKTIFPCSIDAIEKVYR